MNYVATNDHHGWLADYENLNVHQEKFLLDLVHLHRNTSFGLDHRFKVIREVKEFQACTQITNYHQVYRYIQQMLDGKPNILSPAAVTHWITTSGTTGKPKLYPYNENFERNFWISSYTLVSNMMHHLGSAGQKLHNGETVLIHAADVPGTRGEGVTKKPVSFFSNWMAKEGQLQASVELSTIQQLEDWQEKMLALAAYYVQKNVTYISGITPFVLVFLQNIEQAFQGQLIQKVGEQNRPLAKRLEDIYRSEGKLPIRAIWNDITCLSLGGVNPYQYKGLLDKVLPDCPIFQSYIGSEGFHGFQYERNSPLMALHSQNAFYEFIDADQYSNWTVNPHNIPVRPTVADVVEGKEYVLCITNFIGLVCYVIGDVIRVKSLKPFLFEYAHRLGKAVNLAGEKLNEGQITDAFMGVMNEQGNLCGDFMSVATFEPHPHYVILAEFHDWAIDLVKTATEIESKLCKTNVIYNEARKMGGLGPLRLVQLYTGELNQYMRIQADKGQWNLGQKKLPKLTDEPGILNHFNAQATGVSSLMSSLQISG